MVMEAQPSPQCVGREFVRQYYTLLNQAPAHLHRFYNHNSLFVHGGLEPSSCETNPVVGQKQIHQRIQQLKFVDCHAKISQVDSQATLGNGVVVQVSGELSNNGQPMRRFTQTFVLAAQSPKKYYVHNDIFRYQDMFGDEEMEAESGRTDDDEQAVDQERTGGGDITQQSIQGSGYYGGVGTGGVAVNGGAHHDEVTVQPSAPPQPPQAIPPPQMMQPPLYSPTIDFHHLQQQSQQPLQNAATTPQQALQQSQPPQIQEQLGQQINQSQTVNLTAASNIQDIYHHNAAGEHIGEEEEEEEAEVEEEPTVSVAEEPQLVEEEHHDMKQSLDENNYPSLDHDSEQHHQIETVPAPNEPPTYATRLKSGTPSSAITSGLNISPQGPAKSPSSPPPGMRLETRNSDINMVSGRGQSVGRGGARGGAAVRGMNRGSERTGLPRPAPSDDGNNFGDDKRRSGVPQQQHPDNQQLFLGNLPLDCTESDLRSLFGKFGSIIDLRIMNKPNMKGQTGNKVPNYGFIVFDEVQTVQTVLNNRPFFFPPESGPNGSKLNVEEKKTRARGSTDGRIGGAGGDSRGGPRMGPVGPPLRGGNRGGFIQARGGMFPHSRGGAPMRPGGPGGPGFNQRSSMPR